MRLSAPHAAARHAGLIYTCDTRPGITRKRRGSGFQYLYPNAKPVRSNQELARIRALAIPPAWTHVWICPSPNGHIQATGLDARGRKQYKYHPDWTAHRNRSKFNSLGEFGSSLARLRARIDRDLKRPGLPRDKVAACIVHLIDQTYIRIGNSSYARDNGSFGLATMRNNHAKVRGSEIQFRFKAKGGALCDMTFESRRAASIIRACQDLPGQELFCYVDEAGETRDIGSGDVNAYLAAATGHPFTARDFRTWGGTCAAAQALIDAGPPEFNGKPLNQAQLKHRETAAVKAAAQTLGNTVTVCRKFYIHPDLIHWYAHTHLHTAFATATAARTPRLSPQERALLALLRKAALRTAAA